MTRDYDITFTDGTGITIAGVTRGTISNGVLTLYRRNTVSDAEKHLGSWPIVNIRKWVKT
jgi:hypothetical protein